LSSFFALLAFDLRDHVEHRLKRDKATRQRPQFLLRAVFRGASTLVTGTGADIVGPFSVAARPGIRNGLRAACARRGYAAFF
jgi:hypothetical protein